MTLHAETSPPPGPPQPGLQVRGRSFMALVMTPEVPLAAWFADLDAQLRDAASLFADRPLVVDLSRAAAEGRDAVLILLDGLETRGLRIVGLEGASPQLLTSTHWERLPTQLHGREVAEVRAPRRPAAAAPPPASLLIDGPVRSGQSVVFEGGDVTIVGAVASGAEVIAGGSIHVYGALRGRAIAGIRLGAEARIFCGRMEAEMVGIERLYRTAEHWGPDLHGRPAQLRCDRGALRLSALD
ncbi:septum site-determining protein MinC [Phenylobacterium sp. LjRoot225]|uniref:septum site-determining protein MinC n=1 Tax=Phenylobacterium sp. LjRoot225 TaxID=3342285 RepID=UPI003ECD3EC2